MGIKQYYEYDEKTFYTAMPVVCDFIGVESDARRCEGASVA
jgi:hypothetical protein